MRVFKWDRFGVAVNLRPFKKILTNRTFRDLKKTHACLLNPKSCCNKPLLKIFVYFMNVMFSISPWKL